LIYTIIFIFYFFMFSWLCTLRTWAWYSRRKWWPGSAFACGSGSDGWRETVGSKNWMGRRINGTNQSWHRMLEFIYQN